MSKPENIFPVFDKILGKKEKQMLLQQQGKVFWLTGLSGSGKTTIAQGVEKELYKKGLLTQILDGDNIRSGINNNLGFSENDRKENIRRIAEVSKLFSNCGIITINSFVSPTKEIRELAESVIGKGDFFEIFINTPLEICEQRDPKGLYKKARKGEIKEFTGISAPFEAPQNPALELKTDQKTKEEVVKELTDFILSKTDFKKQYGSI